MKTLRLRYGILAADLCWTVSALFWAYGFRSRPTWQLSARIPFPALLTILVATVIAWSGLSLWLHPDGFHGGWRFPAMVSQLLPATAGLMALLFAGAYLAHWYTSRLLLGYFGVLLFLGWVTIRLCACALLSARCRSGAVRRVVIIGNGPIAKEIERKIECHPEMLWKVVGLLCPAENFVHRGLPAENAPAIPVGSAGIAELLRSRTVDELILAVANPAHPEISDLVSHCLKEGIAVSVVPQPYELYLSRPKLLDLDGLPLLELESAARAQRIPRGKRSLDLALTCCLLPFAAPAIVAAAAWLKIQRGKAFCRETRCGQFGETFAMYRLNSERHATGLPLAEFLMQRCSLTELPQLLNVLRGEMSLVGPRPEEPGKILHYNDWQRRRLAVKPGITGLAQVHGVRDQHSSEDKSRYDLQYILHASLFLDISLLLQTLSTLTLRLFEPGQWTARRRIDQLNTARTTFQETLSNAHRSQSSAD